MSFMKSGFVEKSTPTNSDEPSSARCAMRAVPTELRASRGCCSSTNRARVVCAAIWLHQHPLSAWRQRGQFGRVSGTGSDFTAGYR